MAFSFLSLLFRDEDCFAIQLQRFAKVGASQRLGARAHHRRFCGHSKVQALQKASGLSEGRGHFASVPAGSAGAIGESFRSQTRDVAENGQDRVPGK